MLHFTALLYHRGRGLRNNNLIFAVPAWEGGIQTNGRATAPTPCCLRAQPGQFDRTRTMTSTLASPLVQVMVVCPTPVAFTKPSEVTLATSSLALDQE